MANVLLRSLLVIVVLFLIFTHFYEDIKYLAQSSGFTSGAVTQKSSRRKPHPLDGTQLDVGEGLLGVIEDGRLVVNANASISRAFVMWGPPQVKLCRLLQNMTHGQLGQPIQQTNDTTSILSLPSRPLLNITLDCTGAIKGLGQGNWITVFYLVRMAVALARVDLQFQCDVEASDNPNGLLPFLAGYYPAPGPIGSKDEWPYADSKATENDACRAHEVRKPYGRIRIDKVAGMIRNDIQKLAVTVAGSFDGTYQHHDIPLDQTPLYPDIVLDDVAIHLRCGDIFGRVKRYDFGLIAFSAYKQYILRDGRVKRIGIMTQPFDASRNRPADGGKVEQCKQFTYKLVDYLRDAMAPYSGNVTISIHNGPNETLPSTYARLTMAKQSFCSLSSFGIFPILATFGEGYFQKGNGGVNPFAQFVPTYTNFSNIHMMNAPVMPAARIKGQPLDQVFEWFLHEGEEAVQNQTRRRRRLERLRDRERL